MEFTSAVLSALTGKIRTCLVGVAGICQVDSVGVAMVIRDTQEAGIGRAVERLLKSQCAPKLNEISELHVSVFILTTLNVVRVYV